MIGMYNGNTLCVLYIIKLFTMCTQCQICWTRKWNFCQYWEYQIWKDRFPQRHSQGLGQSPWRCCWKQKELSLWLWRPWYVSTVFPISTSHHIPASLCPRIAERTFQKSYLSPFAVLLYCLPVEKLMFSWVILSCFCSISQSISACRAGNIFRSSCTTRDLQFDGYSLLFHSAGRWWSVNNFTLRHTYSHYYQLPIKQSTVNQAVFNKQVNLSSTRQLVNHKSGMFGLHLGQPWLPANKNKWDH